MNCRYCKTALEFKFLDLGFAPPTNSYLKQEDLYKPEITYPLRLFVCENCFLVQTEDYAQSDEIFLTDYAYYSSVSKFFLDHAKSYAYKIARQLQLDTNSFVIEVASNDGYLLRNFVDMGIPCMGIEPTDTVIAAKNLGIPVIQDFFGYQFALDFRKENAMADLVIGNNVFAHVPDINDFTLGLKTVLNKGGTITLEFQHILNMIALNQFDTIYHEHYSYLSLDVVCKIFETHGLKVFDVEKITPHGGSLRIYGCHLDDERVVLPSVNEVLRQEKDFGLTNLKTYKGFQQKVNNTKYDLIDFLIEQKRKGKLVTAYGAASKASALFNYAGIKPDLIPYVYDAADSKQGKYLPGNHIPILPISDLEKHKPDFILIIPWNIKDEIIKQLGYTREWGAVFFTAISELKFHTHI